MILAGIIIALFAFLILFKKKVVKTKEVIQEYMTRGYKNKNPGNIRLTPKKWKGEIEGKDKAFKTFLSMPYGYRALFALLREYMNKGYDTIEKIINRYAPGSENNTEAYINTVCKKTGLKRDEFLNFENKEKVTKIVAAISFVENGIAADIEDINEGYKLLLT